MPKKQGVGETNWNKKEKKIPWEGSPIGERLGLRGEGGTEKGSVYQPEAKGLEKRTPDKPIPAAHAKVDVQPAYAPEKRDSVGEVSLPYAAGLQAKREIPAPKPFGSGTKSPPALGEKKPFAPYMAGRDEGTATGIPYAAGVQTGLGSAGPAAAPKETKTQSWSRRKPPSRSSEDILEELMTLERYYDDLGQEADAWVFPAAIRETGDVPLEATTIKPYLDVLQKEWEDAKNWEWEEKKKRGGYRDPTLRDLTVGSFWQGYDTAQYGKESFGKMMGDENNKTEEYEEKLAGNEYKFMPETWWEKLLSQTSSWAGGEVSKILSPETWAMAGGAIGTAALVGQAGPLVAVPEELATIPGAAIVGYGAGSAMTNMKIQAGLAYDAMRKNGVSEETARAIAMIVGGANGIVDVIPADSLLKFIGILDDSGAPKEAIKLFWNELKKAGVDMNKIAEMISKTTLQEGIGKVGIGIGTMLEPGKQAPASEEREGGETTEGEANPWISDHTAEKLLGDRQMLDYLTRQGGLRLRKDMKPEERIAAIKEATATVINKPKKDPSEHKGQKRF